MAGSTHTWPLANMTSSLKTSRATQLWLGVLGAVLAVLYLETNGPSHRGFNLFISTDSTSRGAQVVVDGQQVGTIDQPHSSGIGGGAFWGHLTRGKHTIELKKPGFTPFSKDIDMHGEEYLGVDLKPLKD